MHRRTKRRAWKCAGWAGIAVLFLPVATLFLPSLELAAMVEIGGFACGVLCMAAGFAYKKWYLVPGSIGAGTALVVFIGYTLPTLLETVR